MAIIDSKTTSTPAAVINTAAQKDVTRGQQQQEFFTMLQAQPYSITLKASDDGSIQSEVTALSALNTAVFPEVVRSSNKDCNLSIYTSAKCSKDDIFMNRSRSCEATSDGNTFRLGSRIFFKSGHDTKEKSVEHLDIPNFSLYIDNIERHGRYLFVTSRQKLSEPPIEEEANDVKSKTDKSAKALLDAANNQTDDRSESDSEESASDFSVESEELSAYESWSEASTEHSETEVLKDTRPQYAAMPGDQKQNGKTSTSDSEDSSASSEDSNGSADEDSDAESIEAPNTRYAHVLDDEEEEQLWDVIWADPDEPGFDGDEYTGAWGSGEESDDGARDQDISDSDSASDSEKDNTKKEDEPKEDIEIKKDEPIGDASSDSKEVRNLKSADDIAKIFASEAGGIAKPDSAVDENKSSEGAGTGSNEDPNEKKETPPSMLGTAVSQLQVYNLSDSPPTRMFRFTRPIMQPIRNSPVAVHPTQSLAVWPLGDSNMLFADYKDNTYFVRKFRVSRFWSQHVKIECHFSLDGKYLHVASLEMRRNLPVKKKGKKSTTKAKDEKVTKGKDDAEVKEEEEKTKSECDLLILTYKLSSRKTTRAPPVLVHRTQLPIGRIGLVKALPTFTWTADEIFITHTVEDDLKVMRIALSKYASSGSTEMTAAVHIPEMPIRLGKSDQNAESYFLPSSSNEHKARVVITMEQSTLRKINPSTDEGKDTTEMSDSETPEYTKNDLDKSAGKQLSETPNSIDAEGKLRTNLKTLPESRSGIVEYRIQTMELELGRSFDGWKKIDASQLSKTFEDGLGQMEVEMVKFDRTDDCNCGDD